MAEPLQYLVNGKTLFLDPEDPGAAEAMAWAEKHGHRQVTEAAPLTGLEKLKQAAAGAKESAEVAARGVASGASAGLSRVLLAGSSFGLPAEDPREQLRQRENAEVARAEQAHPILHGAGEFAGMVVSPLGKAGEGVTAALKGTSALSRIGASAAGNALTGGLYGAGNTLSDAALGDHELTAQQLISHTGLGSLLGAGGGAFGQAVGEGAQKLVPRLQKALEGASDSLEGLASNKALKAAGATKRDLDFLGEDKAREVGKLLIERGHLGQGAEAPTASGVLSSVVDDKAKVGSRIGAIYDAVEASGVKPEYAAVTKNLEAFKAGLSPLQRKAIQGEVDSVKGAVAEYEKTGGGFKKLQELKQDLQAKAKWSAADPSQAFAGGLKRQLSGVVRDSLDSQIVQHLGSDAGKEFVDATKTYGLLSSAERIAEHGVERLGGNASFGLRDTMMAAGQFAAGNPATGVVAAIASKLWRERGDGLVARIASKLSDSPAMSTIAADFSSKLARLTPVLGEYGGKLATAAAVSPQHALATHMALAQIDPHYQQAAQAAGLFPESPGQQGAALIKAHGISQLAANVAAHEDELDRHIERVVKGASTGAARSVFGSSDFGAKRQRKDDESAHEQHLKDVAALTDPSALLERTSANLGNVANVAPTVAASMTATAQRAVQYLAAQNKTPPKTAPLAPDIKANAAQRREYSQKLEVTQDPMAALRHAAAGTLVPPHMEALNAVYPTLARHISDKALLAIAHGPTVPPRSRLMLRLLTGTDVDGRGGAAVARNQQAIHAQSQKPSNQMGPGPSAKGAEKLTLAQRTATPQQRREMKED